MASVSQNVDLDFLCDCGVLRHFWSILVLRQFLPLDLAQGEYLPRNGIHPCCFTFQSPGDKYEYSEHWPKRTDTIS